MRDHSENSGFGDLPQEAINSSIGNAIIAYYQATPASPGGN